MFKFIGLVAGMIICLILGVNDIKGNRYFLVCFFFMVATFISFIVFRVLASHFVGFWKVWMKRWKKPIQAAKQCLQNYTKIPKYQIQSIKVDAYGNRVVSKMTESNTLTWGLFDLAFFAVLNLISYVLLVVVLISYGEGIYYQRKIRKWEKVGNKLKNSDVLKSGKEKLNEPLSDVITRDKKQYKNLNKKRKRQLYVDHVLSFNKNFPSQLMISQIEQLRFAQRNDEDEQFQQSSRTSSIINKTSLAKEELDTSKGSMLKSKTEDEDSVMPLKKKEISNLSELSQLSTTSKNQIPRKYNINPHTSFRNEQL